MELKMNSADAKEYSSLYVAARDLSAAASYAHYIQKKRWHGWPKLRRGSVSVQQQAFTDAFVLAYGRIWSPRVLKGFTWTDASDRALHEHLMDLRNKVVGHSAPPKYNVRPWVTEDFSTHIFGSPHTHFTPEQLDQLIRMIDVMRVEGKQRRLRLLEKYLDKRRAMAIMRT